MKKFFTIFFVTLGVAFLILIVVAALFLYIDPFNFRGLLMPPQEEILIDMHDSSSEEGVEDRNPALTPTQESALDAVGIDPARVPTSFTPEQEACFVEVLGEARVAEIKAGAIPTASEFFQARGCVE